MRSALVISSFLCASSAILILLILLAGMNENILVDWFFLKTSTAELNVKPELAKSDFLKDLSTITGSDFVGSNATAKTLELADTYTVSLFSSCAQNETDTKCTSNEMGYQFNPIKAMNLENTGIEESLSSDFLTSIDYEIAAEFITFAHIFALGMTGGAAALILQSCYSPNMINSVILSSILATMLELAAATVSTATFTNLKRKFNEEFQEAGIKTVLGNNLFIASWTAFGILLVNSIFLCLYRRRRKQNRHRGIARGKGATDHMGLDNPGGDVKASALLKQIRALQFTKDDLPGFGGKHKYSQIKKQLGAESIAVSGHDSDCDMLVTSGFGGGDDGHDEHDLGRASTRGIRMHSLRVHRARSL